MSGDDPARGEGTAAAGASRPAPAPAPAEDDLEPFASPPPPPAAPPPPRGDYPGGVTADEVESLVRRVEDALGPDQGAGPACRRACREGRSPAVLAAALDDAIDGGYTGRGWKYLLGIARGIEARGGLEARRAEQSRRDAARAPAPVRDDAPRPLPDHVLEYAAYLRAEKARKAAEREATVRARDLIPARFVAPPDAPPKGVTA